MSICCEGDLQIYGKPTILSAEALKRLGRYLVSYPRLVYEYPFQDAVDGIDVYVDTDHAGCLRTRKSTSGGRIIAGKHLLKSWSSTQPIVTFQWRSRTTRSGKRRSEWTWLSRSTQRLQHPDEASTMDGFVGFEGDVLKTRPRKGTSSRRTGSLDSTTATQRGLLPPQSKGRRQSGRFIYQSVTDEPSNTGTAEYARLQLQTRKSHKRPSIEEERGVEEDL